MQHIHLIFAMWQALCWVLIPNQMKAVVWVWSHGIRWAGKAGWQVNMNRPDAYYDREMEYYDRETKKHQMNNSFFCQGRIIKTKVILNCSLVNPFSKTISVNGTSIHPAAMLETHVSSLIFSSTTSHIPGVSKPCQLYLQMMSCIHSLLFSPRLPANSSCHQWLNYSNSL